VVRLQIQMKMPKLVQKRIGSDNRQLAEWVQIRIDPELPAEVVHMAVGHIDLELLAVLAVLVVRNLVVLAVLAAHVVEMGTILAVVLAVPVG